jgi:hypothetical protein
MRYPPLLAICGIALGTALPVQAQDSPASPQESQALWVFGQGYYDVVDQSPGAVDLRAEYRDAGRLWVLRPWAGLEVSSLVSLYAAGGVVADVKLPGGFVLTPGFGAGVFLQDGGKDLGFPIQFRSQLELAWRTASGGRIGIAFSHMSNADLAGPNPGAEVLTVFLGLTSRELSGRDELLQSAF